MDNCEESDVGSLMSDHDEGVHDTADIADDFRHPSDDSSDAIKFKEQALDGQWKEVIDLLVAGQVRWDEFDERHHIPFLELYKKEALTMRDLRERTTPTFLHILAKELNKEVFEPLRRPKSDLLQKIIRYLLDHLLEHREHTVVEDTSGIREDPILKVAMDFHNYEFIELVATYSTTALSELLDASDFEKINCLHYAFKVQLPAIMERFKQGGSIAPKESIVLKKRLKKTLDAIYGFVDAAKPETIASQDKHGNTPIHYALNYKFCRLKTDDYSKMTSTLLRKGDKVLKKNAACQFNDKNESPYLYYLQTRKRFRETERTRALRPNEAPTDAPVNGDKKYSRKETKGTETLKERYTRENRKEEHGGKYIHSKPGDAEDTTSQRPHLPQDEASSLMRPPAQIAPNANADVLADAQGVGSLSRLARRRTQSLTQTAKTPQLKTSLNEIPNDGKQTSSSPRNKESIDPDIVSQEIGDFVKVHYIRNRTDLEAKELLYGKVASGKYGILIRKRLYTLTNLPDKNLYLDATHLKGKSVDKLINLIESLASGGGFEDTLSYVSLPVLSSYYDKPNPSSSENKSYGANEGRQRGVELQGGQTIGRSALIRVFDKLASLKIRNILRLHVDDRDGIPHTDAAIERAIRGRDRFGLENGRSDAIHVETW